MSRLIIHASNVHQGGGRALLEALLQCEPVISTVVVVDARMPLPADIERKLTIRRVAPHVLSRLRAEMWLAKNALPGDTVLSFGNLPPLFKSAGRVVVFLQNKYLVSRTSLAALGLKTRMRLRVERWWFKNFATNVDEYIVQTPSMQEALLATLSCPAGDDPAFTTPVSVMPFVESVRHFSRKSGAIAGGTASAAFVYVASGDAHKNHRCLISAWRLLAQDGMFPQLTLTIDRQGFPGLCGWIDEQVSRSGLKVENRGVLSTSEVALLYAQADALVYPSVFESFGLPLIEARSAGLPIIASELDFVRDVLDPDQTFDPQSPRSLARAVKRFLGGDDDGLVLRDAADFLRHVAGQAPHSQ